MATQTLQLRPRALCKLSVPWKSRPGSVTDPAAFPAHCEALNSATEMNTLMYCEDTSLQISVCIVSCRQLWTGLCNFFRGFKLSI